MKQIEEQQKLA